MPAKSTPNRYGSIATAIHWLTALLVLALIIAGLTAANTPDSAAKAAILRLHAPVGVAVLALTVFRILWWLLFDTSPRPMATVPPIQNAAAKAVHGLLYLALIAMAGSGMALMVQSGAGEVVFGTGGPLPDLWTYTPRTVHAIVGWGLMLLILGHVAAAFYHQFFVGDRLLGRMGIGQPPTGP